VVVEHAVIEPEFAGFCLHPRHPRAPLFELALIETEMDAARPFVPHRDARAL
jgi:hypothetical protein